MEERISSLEEFQKKWKFYFWAVVVVGTLTTAVLGWNVNQINVKLEELNIDLKKAEEHLNDLHIKSNVAEKASDNALRQAGDLDSALIEAKSAYNKASDAADKSVKSSKDAIMASENALKASNESRAISAAVDQKIRQLEVIIAEVKTIKSNITTTTTHSEKPFLVNLSGTSLHVNFVEGDTPYDDVTLNQSYYRGTIYIPKNRIAKVTGAIEYCTFTIAQELKGRVIDNTKGSSNRWSQQ